MNFGIIIQARTGSKRFPNKILKKINNNYNVLEFFITRILNQFDKKNLLIATTKLKRDRKIINISKKFKINIFNLKKDTQASYHCYKSLFCDMPLTLV